MHIHYFQHDHFENLDYIGEWAALHDISTSVTRFDKDAVFPQHTDYEWLIVMGGKMGVNDTGEFPWIRQEIAFIAEAIALGKVAIGICLGSQLVAAALGAGVTRSQEPEMGFWPVEFSMEAAQDPYFSVFPPQLVVMHMHNDQFDLPQGALALASSAVTPCQAFRKGNHVFAFQFHFEISEANAAEFIREITPEISSGPWVQQAAEMLEQTGVCRQNNIIFSRFLDRILYQQQLDIQ